MKNHIPSENLSAYLDGALRPEEMRETALHLSECSSCRLHWEALQRVSTVLRQQPPVPVPPFFAARLTNTIKAQRQQSLPADFVWLGKRLVPALALMLAIFLAWGPFESQESQFEENDYLSAAGAGSDIALLAENNGALTKDEVLELVVLSSASAPE